MKISWSVFQTWTECNICLSNIYLSIIIKYISTFSILLDVVAAMVLDLPFGVVAMLTGTAVIPLRRAVAAVEGNKIAGIKRIGKCLYFLEFNRIILRYMSIRQGWYWQIAKYGFLIAWTGIKMRCSKTILYVDWRSFV